jgi:hypothetical protein
MELQRLFHSAGLTYAVPVKDLDQSLALLLQLAEDAEAQVTRYKGKDLSRLVWFVVIAMD